MRVNFTSVLLCTIWCSIINSPCAKHFYLCILVLRNLQHTKLILKSTNSEHSTTSGRCLYELSYVKRNTDIKYKRLTRKTGDYSVYNSSVVKILYGLIWNTNFESTSRSLKISLISTVSAVTLLILEFY